MIGVLANPFDHSVVREFFELFKTPWEFYCSNKHYDALLCATNQDIPANSAQVVLLYSARQVPFDATEGLEITSAEGNGNPEIFEDKHIPIYGQRTQLRRLSTGEGSSLYRFASRTGNGKGRLIVRIGYDLFSEVRLLLTSGQPATNAAYPTLELHIALLRSLLAKEIAFAEIPPVPEGYKFIACLTHDLDHPSIKLHKFDLTVCGFLYRAMLGSMGRLFKGDISFHKVFLNWKSVLKLPLVHLGLVEDFWLDFIRYATLDHGASSFFVIPFKNNPGRTYYGHAPMERASRYAAAEISIQIEHLSSLGCEIGLHGIDAWLDPAIAHEERAEIRRLTRTQIAGVRMHWLYSDDQSPAALEGAGFAYDSTIGYNDAVGYRAGTSQVYKPLGVSRILELPLHVMDTALFSRKRLRLSAQEARNRIARIIDNAARFGGVVTVNWHDRSIAPERLWDDVYLELVEELRSRGAWFATASQAVSWFGKRRSAQFSDGAVRCTNVEPSLEGKDGLPSLIVHQHQNTSRGETNMCAGNVVLASA